MAKEEMWVSKGIFCLEGMWDSQISNTFSVLPILELLKKSAGVNYVYHNCATREEVDFFLNKWKSNTIRKKFPILYLGFHGGSEFFTILHNNKTEYTIIDLAEELKGSCAGSVVFFASCQTMNMERAKIQSFLKKTKFLAALGYGNEIDWLKSTVFEILVLAAMQKDFFNKKGIENIQRIIKKEGCGLNEGLSFKMVINNSTKK